MVHIIFGRRGKLDWQRLRQLVGEHWEILLWELILFQYVYPAKSNYIPREVWEDLLSRLRSELDDPGREAPFRGSLLDEKMFAIDVQEWGMENLLEENREQREPKIIAMAQANTIENVKTNETETDA